MNTTSLHIKIDDTIKSQAQHTADELGLSLSAVVKVLLKQFIRTRSLSVDLDERPTAYFKQLLKEADEDMQAGRVSPTFTNAKDAITWLNEPKATYENGDKVHDKI
ncbi:MAG: type II toxin-antitoxin system RelB/DinJ family antitoxin [Patescibacteria group bacterium]